MNSGTIKYAKHKYKNATLVDGVKLTYKMVNKAIQERFPNVILVKGNGYHYIASDDHETGLLIAGFYETSIPVYKLNECTLETWVSSVENLMKQASE